MSAESLDALAAARDAAGRAGYEIIDADGVLKDATAVYNMLRDDLDVLDDLRALTGDDIDLLCPGTRAALAGPPGRGWGDPSVREAWRYSREIVARVAAVLADADALVLPVAPVSAVAHGEGAEVDGQLIQGPALMAQCRAISLTGLPALAMPTMATDGGRTTGVQIVGPPAGTRGAARSPPRSPPSCAGSRRARGGRGRGGRGGRQPAEDARAGPANG